MTKKERWNPWADTSDKEKEQDRLWMSLTDESKKEWREFYSSEKTGDHFEGQKRMLREIFGKHNLEPVPTYEEVAEALFENKTGWYVGKSDRPEIFHFGNCGLAFPFNATSERQLEKLGAINKLLNVAKYLNKNYDGSMWEPDWEDPDQLKWFPCVENGRCFPDYTHVNCSPVYFRSADLCKEAIEILGQNLISLAFSSRY